MNMVKRKKRLAPFSILCSLLKAVMHCMHVPGKSTCSLPSLWFCFIFFTRGSQSSCILTDIVDKYPDFIDQNTSHP